MYKRGETQKYKKRKTINRKKTKQPKKSKVGHKMKNRKTTKNQKPKETLNAEFFPDALLSFLCFFFVERI